MFTLKSFLAVLMSRMDIFVMFHRSEVQKGEVAYIEEKPGSNNTSYLCKID